MDKVKHFIVGCIISLICIKFNVWLNIGLVSFIAVLKETYDYRHPNKHTVESLDILATILGGLFILTSKNIMGV